MCLHSCFVSSPQYDDLSVAINRFTVQGWIPPRSRCCMHGRRSQAGRGNQWREPVKPLLDPSRKTAFISQLSSDHNILGLNLYLNSKVQGQRVAAIKTLCCYDISRCISFNIKPEKLSLEQNGNLIYQMFGSLCWVNMVSVGSWYLSQKKKKNHFKLVFSSNMSLRALFWKYFLTLRRNLPGISRKKILCLETSLLFTRTGIPDWL